MFEDLLVLLLIGLLTSQVKGSSRWMCDMPFGLWVPVDAAIIKGWASTCKHACPLFTPFGFLMPSFNEWKLSRKLIMGILLPYSPL